ncbi:hypothetical protein ABIF63_000233 [Bradyrhizobium japonicum]|uniref:Uncharacterized protein n=1 Tax=Bradyrhizobium japonicum TaxID=375 RepID=A0ABV2RHQ2_BRAJP
MKTIFSATAAFVLLTTAALADEPSSAHPNGRAAEESAKQAEDCAKQVWPNFSEACLHSVGKRIVVRLVTTERR